MIKIRKNDERGYTNLGWLKSYHTFSFGNYFDKNHMEFGKLRVLNDDTVKPGAGFGSHSHRDMEIITYVLEGELIHGDSMGNSSVLYKNDFQKITAGTGIVHSEYNNSGTDILRFIQIWIVPDRAGYKPSYQQIKLEKGDYKNRIKLIASGSSREDGVLHINQDTNIYLSVLDKDKLVHDAKPDRYVWIQVTGGDISVNGVAMTAGDGVAVREENEIKFEANGSAEFLLFDMVS